jgi:hypothetical protein
VYPLIARINDSRTDSVAKKTVKNHIAEFVPVKWDDLNKISTSCGQSWLDLEGRSFTLAELAKRYDARIEWKLEGPWLERLWTHSEELEKAGKKVDATKIWERIAKDAPETSFENKMAKTRLDPRETEFEGIWK